MSLGAYEFTATPSVSPSNYAPDGTAAQTTSLSAPSPSIRSTAPTCPTPSRPTRSSTRTRTSTSDRSPARSTINTPQNVIALPACTGCLGIVRPSRRAQHPPMDALLQLLLAAYKMFDKATMSYVKLPNGKIVNGSESVSYDDRTAGSELRREGPERPQRQVDDDHDQQRRHPSGPCLRVDRSEAGRQRGRTRQASRRGERSRRRSRGVFSRPGARSASRSVTVVTQAWVAPTDMPKAAAILARVSWQRSYTSARRCGGSLHCRPPSWVTTSIVTH